MFQQLLLRTSLLDQVSGELADLLTARTGSERILLALEDANAFVVSLDPERMWFRYHHLFARICSGWSYAGGSPTKCRRCTGGPPSGSSSMARRPTPSGTPRRRATGLMRPGCSPTTRFGLTMDGQEQTVGALLRTFPPGADYPELALIRAGHNLAQGRLDEAAAHLAVAEAHAETTPPDRQRRLRVAIASLKLALAARRGHLVPRARRRDQPQARESPAVQAWCSRVGVRALLPVAPPGGGLAARAGRRRWRPAAGARGPGRRPRRRPRISATIPACPGVAAFRRGLVRARGASTRPWPSRPSPGYRPSWRTIPHTARWPRQAWISPRPDG